jgi:anti-sigma factor RsiW
MGLEKTHEDVRAALAAEALGILDAAEHEAVAAHLAGCAECRAELEAYREAGGALAYSAPLERMEAGRSAGVRGRLLERAAADRVARGGSRSGDARVSTPLVDPQPARVIPLERPATRAPQPGWLLAAASLVLLIGVGAYALRLQGRVDALGEELAAAESRARASAEEVAKRDALIAGLAAPGVRVIDLASTRQQDPTGRMFWDPATDRWTFYAHHLPQVREGREYQLWLITPSGPVGAGTFRPGENGSATVQATYDLPPDQLRAVAVTEEPAGGRS